MLLTQAYTKMVKRIFEIGAQMGLIGKLVKSQRGPATVTGSKLKICHWDNNLGKV